MAAGAGARVLEDGVWVLGVCWLLVAEVLSDERLLLLELEVKLRFADLWKKLVSDAYF